MNRRTLLRFSITVSLLTAASVSSAQNNLEIIILRHRTAEQVLPALQPLLEPGGTLSGTRNRLIVRTSPANLAELRRALDAIDRPAARLQISVRFDDAFERSSRALGASGRIGTGGSNIEIRARDSASSAEERVDQRVQVVEGGRATIHTGDSRPVRERRYIQTPGGVVSQEVTVVQDSRLGFDVVPRLAGSRVELEIATANGFTTAAGPIGEWFELGAVANSRDREDRGIASSSSRSTGESRRIWVRVDRLP